MQGYIHAFSLNGTYYLVCFSNDYLTSIFLLGKTSKIYRISQVREWVHLYNWNSSKLLLCLLLEMANGNDNLLPLQPLAVHRYSDHSPDFCRDMWLRKSCGLRPQLNMAASGRVYGLLWLQDCCCLCIIS